MSSTGPVRAVSLRSHARRSRLGLAMALALGLPGALHAQVAADGPVADSTLVTVAATAPTPYAWRGREAEIEEFLRTAPVERWKDIPVGITKPRRGYFAPGGLAGSMAWKPLPTGLLHGKRESYRSEIAAYLLSRHLGLDAVPPVVEREIAGSKGAAVYWIEGVKPWDPADRPKGPGANWSRQTSRMLMFDQLIANTDRNQGNLLYDAAGHLYFIDHSRAFGEQRHLQGLKPPQQFDRALWTRMEALTREDLEAQVGSWLTGAQIEALLDRRDAMARHIARQVRDRGDHVIFLPAPSPAAAAPVVVGSTY